MSDLTDAEARSVIEEGTELEGTLASQCPVVVNGRLEGELDAPELEVAASGSVAGAIRARHLTSRGKLSGRVEADELTLSGSVGEASVIKAEKIRVDLARGGRPGLTLGECTLEVGDEPNKSQRDARMPRSSAMTAGVSLLPSCAPRSHALDDDRVESEGGLEAESPRESAPPGV